jgi:MFS family permease
MKERERENLVQKRVSTDARITVELDSSKSKNTSPWTLLAILSSSLLAVMFAETMLLPALPDIMREFKISYSTSAWIFSAYLIVAAVMTPISGRLSDIHGKKKILLLLLAFILQVF